ncbi:hypothetical protein PTMSG1_01704 [Pyrenophora teres f. maculata]|nr:hypothetical protein PTMSG1_01704 [Pyrenophora teres f. maculata]
MASPGFAAGSEEASKALKLLLDEVHDAGPITPILMEKIKQHAALASQSIFDHYATLNGTVSCHEALIRRRWLRKSPSQRRHVLLGAWPEIVVEHNIDNYHQSKMFEAIRGTGPNPGDHYGMVFPFINQEDLTKPKSLLIYINARGRNAPWNFILSELDFSVQGMVHSHDKKLAAMTISFSRELDPLTYGKVDEQSDIKANGDSADVIRCRLLYGLQLLFVQERILAFLVSCCMSILHDLSMYALLVSPIQAEPPFSELSYQGNIGHISFSEAVIVAPYRNRGIIEMVRLRDYIGAAYNDANDHLWALREDPAYFSETVMDISDHRVEHYKDVENRMDPSIDTPAHLSSVLGQLIVESYTRIYLWHELDSRIAVLDSNYRESQTNKAKLQAVLTREEMLWSLLFEDLVNNRSFIQIPRLLHAAMDQCDCLAQQDKFARDLLTSRISSIITELSVISECLFQIELWMSTPEIAMLYEKEADANCSPVPYRSEETRCELIRIAEVAVHPANEQFNSFIQWVSVMKATTVPHEVVHLVNPIRGRLRYPIDKTRNAGNVKIMRDSESNVDMFWKSVNRIYEEQTGIAQHETIRQCLEHGEQVQRTPAWTSIGTTPPSTKKYEYQPFPEDSHKISLQFTGTFDKISISEKVKQKTRGNQNTSTFASAPPATGTHINIPDSASKDTPKLLNVDKRTQKVFKTLFHVPSAELGDAPKALKWNEFKRAMVRVGFTAEKLQGSAWQFMPTSSVGVKRGIQFHEPHPDSDVPVTLARRFGRRLERVYGWCGDMVRAS